MKFQVDYYEKGEPNKVSQTKIADFENEEKLRQCWDQVEPGWVIIKVTPRDTLTPSEWADYMAWVIHSSMTSVGSARPIPGKDWFMDQVKEIANKGIKEKD